MEFEISNINIISSDYGSSLSDFWITIQIDISEMNKHGAEVFSFHVVSTNRLNKIIEMGSLLGKGLIISNDYNELEIRKTINRLIQNLSSWEELILRLSHYSI